MIKNDIRHMAKSAIRRKAAMLLAVFALICSVSVLTVQAGSVPINNNAHQMISKQLSTETRKQSLEVVELSAQQETESTSSDIQAEPEQQNTTPEQVEPKKSTNAPFFIGALISLGIFVGTIVVCKIKGRK